MKFIRFLVIYTNFAFTLATKWDLTQVLVKKGADIENAPVLTGCKSNFQKMIEFGMMWVDKSLIIDEFWKIDRKDVFITTSPRRWGKTMILSMIDFYHQLPINGDGSIGVREDSPAYHYFMNGSIDWTTAPETTTNPPLISRETTLNHLHLANHPVIHFSGGELTMNNYLNSFSNLIKKIYKSHAYVEEYLLQMLSDPNIKLKVKIKSDLNSYQLYAYSNDLSEEQLRDSIQTLSGILKRVYQREVIILFDEYDGFISNTFFGNFPLAPSYEVLSNFETFFKAFMVNTFKENDFLARGMITGILPLKDASGLSGANNVDLKYLFGPEDFFPFYGVFMPEFREICQKRKLNDKIIETAIKQYDGYTSLSHPDVKMFSIFSVIGFVNTKIVRNYWTQSGLTCSITNLLKQDGFKIEMAQLIKEFKRKSSFSIPYDAVTSLNIVDFINIRLLQTEEIEYNQDSHRVIIFSFLMAAGYVTNYVDEAAISDDTKKKKEEVFLAIPNIEIYDDLKNKFLRSFGLMAEKKSLLDYMRRNESITLQPLIASISKFLVQKVQYQPFAKIQKHSELLSKAFSGRFVGNEKIVESIVLSYILGAVTSKITLESDHHSHIMDQHQWKVDEKFGQEILDIFFLDDIETSAVILKLKYSDGKSQKNILVEAFQQCLRYMLFYSRFSKIDVPVLQFLAMVVYKNATVEAMSIAMHSTEVKDWILIAKDEKFFECVSTMPPTISPKFRRDTLGKYIFLKLNETVPSRIWYARYDPRLSNDILP